MQPLDGFAKPSTDGEQLLRGTPILMVADVSLSSDVSSWIP